MCVGDFIGFVIFSLIMLLIFVTQIKWFSRGGERREISGKERNGIGTTNGRTFVSEKGTCVLTHYGSAKVVAKFDNYCGVCQRNIVRDIHRLVAYDEFTVCYYCWKKWNFINTREKMMILFLKWNLPTDITGIILGKMLDNFWELPHYIIKFPSLVRDILKPHFQKLPKLNLPLSFNEDGKVVTWFLYQRKLFLDMRKPNTYSLYFYHLINDVYTFIQSEKEMNEENLSETFQMIQQYQLLYG